MEFAKKISKKIKRVFNNIYRRYYSLTYKKINCPKEYHGTEYGGWNICPLNITKDSMHLIQHQGVIKWIKTQKVLKKFHLYSNAIAY
jgi:hypothetical protein